MKLSIKLFLATCAVPTLINANILFPLALINDTQKVGYIIIIGLLIKFPFIQLITNFRIFKTACATLLINLISTLVGGFILFTFPLLFLLTSSNRFVLSVGIYGLITLLNTLVEFITLDLVFNIPMRKNNFYWLLLANFLSTSAISLLSTPARLSFPVL